MIGWPQDPASVEAERLVHKARERALPPSRDAKARVWVELERRRAQPPRIGWRLGVMFAAGAACAALAVALLVPRRPVSSLPELSLLELPGVRAVARAGTQAAVGRSPNGRGLDLSLESGSLLLHVLPRPANAPFLVRAPGFTARVVGTVLRVVARPGHSSLAVGHGAVEITTPAGARILVRAGEHWPADDRDAPSLLELERLGEAEGVTADSFVPAVPSPAAPADAPDRLKDENEMYQAGLHALTDEHDARAALAIWQLERGRFPRGVLARDAQASIVDALVALDQRGRALTEAARYLAEAPDGLRAAEMHWVRGTLLIEQGGCRRALPELDRALLRPQAPWAARARAARAACNKRR